MTVVRYGTGTWPRDITEAEWRAREARRNAETELRLISPPPEQIARAEAFYAEYRALCERHGVAVDIYHDELVVMVDGDVVLKGTYEGGNPLVRPMKPDTYHARVRREPAAS